MHLAKGLLSYALLTANPLTHPRGRVLPICCSSAVALPSKDSMALTSPLPLRPPLRPPPRKDTNDKINTETPSAPDYIAHNAPKSTYLILNSPAVASFVLVKGWSQESLETFTNAVNTVVSANPVLTGRATCPKNWWKEPEIGIITGTFLPGKHSFVETIDKTQHVPTPEGLSTPAQLEYIQKHVARHVGSLDSTLQQIHNKTPLFEAKVVLLPDNYACIYTKMSHCIGDIMTYYEILDQVSSVDKGGEINPINWDNPLKAQHEIFPEDLSKRDFNRLYGLPFLAGIASHVPSMFLRKKEYLLLSDKKIKAAKASYKAKGITGVSSNDIITAALCDANRSTDIFAFAMSMRGVSPGLGLRDGGNLHCEIPFQRCGGRNPLVIKDIIEKGRYFEPDEVPAWESWTGKVGRLSNCIVPMNRMSFGGCKPICYCPSKSFLDFTPLDTAIIFRVAKGQDAVLHNFEKVNKKSKLLKDILASDDEQ